MLLLSWWWRAEEAEEEEAEQPAGVSVTHSQLVWWSPGLALLLSRRCLPSPALLGAVCSSWCAEEEKEKEKEEEEDEEAEQPAGKIAGMAVSWCGVTCTCPPAEPQVPM